MRPAKVIYSELAIARDSAPAIWYFDRGLKADRGVGKHDGGKNEALGILIGGYWHGEDISRLTRGRHPMLLIRKSICGLLWLVLN